MNHSRQLVPAISIVATVTAISASIAPASALAEPAPPAPAATPAPPNTSDLPPEKSLSGAVSIADPVDNLPCIGAAKVAWNNRSNELAITSYAQSTNSLVSCIGTVEVKWISGTGKTVTVANRQHELPPTPVCEESTQDCNTTATEDWKGKPDIPDSVVKLTDSMSVGLEFRAEPPMEPPTEPAEPPTEPPAEPPTDLDSTTYGVPAELDASYSSPVVW